MKLFLAVILSLSAVAAADILIEENLEPADDPKIKCASKSQNTEDLGNLENANAYNSENRTDNITQPAENLENSANLTDDLTYSTNNSENATDNLTYSTNNSENATDNLINPIDSIENPANLTDNLTFPTNYSEIAANLTENLTNLANNSENATENLINPNDSKGKPAHPETEDFGNLENADASNSENSGNPADNLTHPAEVLENPAEPEAVEEIEYLNPETLNPTKLIEIKCNRGLPSIADINKYFKTYGGVVVTSDKQRISCVYVYKHEDFNLALELRDLTIAGKSCVISPNTACVQGRTQKKINGARLQL